MRHWIKSRAVRLLFGVVAVATLSMGAAEISSGAATAQSCEKGYFIEDQPLPECEPGCTGTCGCAICSDPGQ